MQVNVSGHHVDVTSQPMNLERIFPLLLGREN